MDQLATIESRFGKRFQLYRFRFDFSKRISKKPEKNLEESGFFDKLFCYCNGWIF
jgi:hypothetical protein